MICLFWFGEKGKTSPISYPISCERGEVKNPYLELNVIWTLNQQSRSYSFLFHATNYLELKLKTFDALSLLAFKHANFDMGC